MFVLGHHGEQLLGGVLHILTHPVLYGLGPLTKTQGGQTLLVVVTAHTQGYDDARAAVPPQTLLQYSCQFAVSVRNEAGFVLTSETVYDVAQGRETLVDVLGLF